MGTMWPAPCREQAGGGGCQCPRAASAAPPPPPRCLPQRRPARSTASSPVPQLSPSSQPYLDSEEGNVGELLHKAPDLVLASYGVEPGPASHLHLGPEAAAPSAPGPALPRGSPRCTGPWAARSSPGPVPRLSPCSARLPSGTGSPQTTHPPGSCRPCRCPRCTPGCGISAEQEELSTAQGGGPRQAEGPAGRAAPCARTMAPSSFRYCSFICM